MEYHAPLHMTFPNTLTYSLKCSQYDISELLVLTPSLKLLLLSLSLSFQWPGPETLGHPCSLFHITQPFCNKSCQLHLQ